MENRIRQLLNQITLLEGELRTALHEQETRVLYQIKGKRVDFERSVREAHRRLRMGFFRWLATSRPQNFLTAPFIYGMVVPLVLFDLCITIYQAVCFPLYRIARVRRSDYIVFDRQHLAYLNSIEKFHCTYCAYANGLIAYACEITARTEQYWCPIKHARKVLGSHSRYARFLAYGEAADFHAKLEQLRAALAEEKERTPAPQDAGG
ncbi:MAG: hypothetical protein M1527_05770 [Gammaproteobacteria bacterium]|nr:hypothetical protein [Gammaproteobacteria bacterium]